MTELISSAAVQYALLLAPGYLILRIFHAPRTWAICTAPLISLATIGITGQVAALAGISSTPPVLSIAFLIICGVCLLLAFTTHARLEKLPCIPIGNVALYVVIGSLLGLNLFISRIGAPNELFQAYDLTQHINVIQAMASSGRFSSFGVSPYLTMPDLAIAPVDYAQFYPTGWHALCSLSIMIAPASVPTAINSSMFVLPCIVFPLAMLAFLSSAFPQDRRMHWLGALFVCAFVAFPWNLLAFGPIYPNAAGFSLMPIAIALFVTIVSKPHDTSERVLLVALLVPSVIGLALCHPNTIFTCVVLLTPFCVFRIWEECRNRSAKPHLAIVACVGFVLFVVAIWILFFNLSIFQDIVRHVWRPYSRPWQQLVNIALLAPTMDFFAEEGAQFLLAALVGIGIIDALRTRDKRWLVFSYAIPCLILLVSATQDGELKQILAGFWYTDPMRLASMCTIAAIPLAILGASCVYEFVMLALSAFSPQSDSTVKPLSVAISLSAAFLVLNFMPSFNVPGEHHEPTPLEQQLNKEREFRDRVKSHRTTFGDYRDVIEEVYHYDAPLDSEERDFIQRVKTLIEPHELVINNPMDGSFLAYGSDALRVYYRNFTRVDGSFETEQSRIIRTRLMQYASDPEVQDALDYTGARYVLVMDANLDDASFINLRGDYKPELYAGITSITPETPGFKLLLAEGQMALYEIIGA